MSVEIVWEPEGVWRKFHGTLTSEDLLRSVTLVHGDWRFDRLRYSLNDFLAVERLDLDRSAIEEAAAQAIGAMHSNHRLIMAMVATNPEVIEAVRLFMSSPLSSFPAAFFTTAEEARLWLGKTPP
jgi:hypothetical protein